MGWYEVGMMFTAVVGVIATAGWVAYERITQTYRAPDGWVDDTLLILAGLLITAMSSLIWPIVFSVATIFGIVSGLSHLFIRLFRDLDDDRLQRRKDIF